MVNLKRVILLSFNIFLLRNTNRTIILIGKYLIEYKKKSIKYDDTKEKNHIKIKIK